MTGHPGERELGNELLHALAHEFPAELGVTQGPMFNGKGLKANGEFLPSSTTSDTSSSNCRIPMSAY